MSASAPVTIGPAGLAGETGRAEHEQVRRAAKEFEALFLLQMLKQMRQSILDESSDQDGFGAATMLDTIDSELARHLAGNGPFMDVLVEAFGGTRGAGPAFRAAATPLVPRTAPVTHHPEASSMAIPGGTITSAFGERADPFGAGRRFHRGIDVRAAYGAEVPAAAEGRVVFAGTKGGYGQMVTVEHANGLRTRYAHLSEIAVREGDVVRRGGLLGRVGQSGRATGPHLHFEVLQNGRPVDPARFQAGLRAGGEPEGAGPENPLKVRPELSITPSGHARTRDEAGS